MPPLRSRILLGSSWLGFRLRYAAFVSGLAGHFLDFVFDVLGIGFLPALAVFLFLLLQLGAEQFEDSELCAITNTKAGMDDARVAPGPRGEAGPDLAKEGQGTTTE